MRRASAATVAGFVVMALSCKDATDPPILIGGIEATGDPVGAAELALREVNAAGGVAGRTVEMPGSAIGQDPLVAPAVVQQMIDDGVVAIVGPQTSAGTLLVADLVAAAGVPVVSPGATSPAVSGSAPPLDYVFRVAPSDVFQARLLAARSLDAWGCTKTAIVTQTDIYGTKIADAVAAFYVARGTALVAREDIDPTLVDFHDALDRIEQAAPDCILLSVFEDAGARVIRQWNDVPARANTAQWGASEILHSENLPTLVGDSALIDGMRGTDVAPEPNTPEYDTFAERYMAHFGGSPSRSGNARRYDATALILLALARTNGARGDALRDALYEVSRPPGTPIRPGELARGISILSNGGDVDFIGASGPVDFDENGDVLSDYIVWRYVAATNSFVTDEYVPVAELP